MHAPASRRLVPATDHARLREGFFGLVEQPDFPCVGAKSAMARGGLVVETAQCITATRDDLRLHHRLVRWTRSHRPDGKMLRSFAVVFAGPFDLDERGFEAALWARLRALTAIDRARGFVPDPQFSTDPRDPAFALSFGGAAYFAVGLHPGASRRARRAPAPTIVFNRHEQFARLRKAKQYERMREVIIARDTEFDGSPNPMIARHGEISEARQYSGRAVDEDWACPLAPSGSQR
ncbi:MAG: guanitoxin biosynthesis heme-dependent pre-guanitoxin N-hydroxylase GntA [Porphyrobacter sp.]|nr:guanitoxin biosynthesis heme-dependent pre-guanitoxin N-hydroxylase GntA [Porphyrobacter sp.]